MKETVKLKQRRTTKDPSTCVEKVVNMSDRQQLVNHLEWIKFKVNKGMFDDKDIADLLKITKVYKFISEDKVKKNGNKKSK